MSNTGQAVLGIVGAVVGFFIGGPTGAVYGFQLGYLAGTALFPTQLPTLQGPRLGEGQQTVSIVGAPIPMIFGTQPVGGIIIWASPLREVSSTQDLGGKGAPEQSQTTYSYFRSFAILLCEGPIGGVRRIWANGKIIFDQSIPAGLTLEDLEELDPVRRRRFAGRAALNNEWTSKMTIYTGTEDQLADPVIESFEGAGNVPGLRGYAYVVFDDVELKPEDGNRIPASWKFEVYEEGEADALDLYAYSNEVLYPWLTGRDPTNPLNTNTITVFATDSACADGTYSNVGEALDAVRVCRGVTGWSGWVLGASATNNPISMGTVWFSQDTEELQAEFRFSNFDSIRAGLYVVNQEPDYMIPGNGFAFYYGSADICSLAIEPRFVPGSTWYNYATAFRLTSDVPSSIGTAPVIPPGFTDRGRCSGSGYWWFQSLETYLMVQRSPSPPPDPCSDPEALLGLPLGYGIWEGQLVPCGDWEFDNTHSYHVLQKFAPVDIHTTKYPLNPCLPVGHPDDIESFWTEAYEEAVALNELPEGLVYGVDYPETQSFGYRKHISTTLVDVQPVTLASIVRRLCARADETLEIDVSDLEDITVIGYQVSRPMYARAAIETLRSVGFFDVVESVLTLRFPTRGKTNIAEFSTDDLGAHYLSDDRPPSSTTSKTNELELPRQIRMHYQNYLRDYDPGEELSPARFDTKAESVTDIDVPVAMLPDQAAQCVEVIYRETWAGRWGHDAASTLKFAHVEPSDCVTLPVDDQNQRVRVVSVTDRLVNLRQFRMVRDDDGSYESTAVGAGNGRTPTSLELYGPVELLLMDLPALSMDGNDAGFYVAARPKLIDGAFRGAVVSKSADGTNFQIVTTVTDPTASGTLVQPLPTGVSTVFDYENELRVYLIEGELESRSEADVLGGANTCAIGAHGRWEIVQFLNAENISGRVWSLTGLLRGRRGTEHVMGSSVIDDDFVMLSTGTLGRIPLTVAEVSAGRTYRAIVPGTGGTSAAFQEFTGAGEALKPFSPVDVQGDRDDDGVITIAWTRRDRLAAFEEPGWTTAPLSEDTEDYEVDVVNESGVVLRTISSSTTEVTYTDDQQITDFGSLQDAVTVRIYQISVQVGRGYPGEAVL